MVRLPTLLALLLLMLPLVAGGCNPPAQPQDESALPGVAGGTKPGQSAPADASTAEPAVRDPARLPAKPAIGEQLPTFTFKTLDGEEKSIEEFIGEPLLLNFWRIQCPPCKAELPEFVKFYRQYQERNLEIITLNTADTAQQHREFMEEQEMPWVLGYEAGELADEWGLQGVPTTLVVDRSGLVLEVKLGRMSPEELEQVANLLFGES